MKIPMIYDAISPGAIIIPGIITLAVIAVILFLLAGSIFYITRSVRRKKEQQKIQEQNEQEK